MADGFKDKMSMGDAQVRSDLKCARCGKSVESNGIHVCSSKEEELNEEHEQCKGASG